MPATRWIAASAAWPTCRNPPGILDRRMPLIDDVTPTSELLAADTAMGAVTLNVADLDAMTAYYRDAVGLEVVDAAGPRVVLGRGAREVVVLEHSPELRHAAPREA